MRPADFLDALSGVDTRKDGLLWGEAKPFPDPAPVVEPEPGPCTTCGDPACTLLPRDVVPPW